MWIAALQSAVKNDQLSTPLAKRGEMATVQLAELFRTRRAPDCDWNPGFRAAPLRNPGCPRGEDHDLPAPAGAEPAGYEIDHGTRIGDQAPGVTGRLEGRAELGIVDDAPEAVMGQCLSELRAGELGVDEDVVGPGCGCCLERFDEAAVVAAHDPDTTIRADPEPLAKYRSESTCPVGQLGIGEPPGLVDHRRLGQRPYCGHGTQSARPA